MKALPRGGPGWFFARIVVVVLLAAAAMFSHAFAATNYPAALDTTTNLPNDYVNGAGTKGVVLATTFNAVTDAIRSIETELGINPSGAASSTVSDRIGSVEVALTGSLTLVVSGPGISTSFSAANPELGIVYVGGPGISVVATP